MAHVKEGVAHVKEGVAHVKEGVAHVKEGVAHVKEGVAHVKEGVAHVKVGVAHVKQASSFFSTTVFQTARTPHSRTVDDISPSHPVVRKFHSLFFSRMVSKF